MAGATTSPIQAFSISKPVKIRNKTILDAAAKIGIYADPEILTAITADDPLDPLRDPIRLAKVKLGVSEPTLSVDFAGGGGTVSFSAAAGVHAGLGVYTQSAEMLKDIAALSGKGNQRIPLDAISFPDISAARYFAFYWGYDVSGSVNGSVALAPGAALNFGAEGARIRGFSVIRAYAENPPARTALVDLFGKSWMLPSQVNGIKDLQPGTWILSEVTGEFRANLGVNFGFDYNWVRSVKIEAAEVLQGDIGLKIQAGANAVFGMSASGRYVVIVGRDSLNPDEKVIRVRLNRLSQKGWNFAFNANLDLITSTGTLLPGQLDDFIAAILGVHGLQILEEVRRWTDPSRRLSDLAAAFLTDFAKNQVGEDFEQKFEEIREKVIGWFEKWDALPSKATSALWDAVRFDRDTVEGFIIQVKRLADPAAVGGELQSLLADVNFASTPIGKWLLAVLEKRILSAITNAPEADRIREAAQKTLDIIDGSLLDELKVFVEDKVGFPVIRKAVEENDFSSLTKLAQNKLAQFLGKNTPLDSEDLQQIRETVNRLLNRGEDLYRAGVKALNDTYKFSFEYAYSKTTTGMALLDVCFDFNANPNLGPELEKAIAGDFTGVLPAPGQPGLNGVTFKEAALTHNIQRQAHVRISLPYFTSETIHETSSLADYKLLSEEGNIYLYSLEADDEVRRVNKWQSSFSISLNLAVGSGREIRRYDKDGSGATIDYRFVQAVPDLRTAQLERFMDPISKLYFKSEFAGIGGADKPSVHEWAIALDKVFDGMGAPEDGLIGNSLISLDVSLPGDILLKWLKAPENKRDHVYMNMSRRFQSLLRLFVPFLYFQDPKKYETLGAAQPLLVYASLPITTSIKVSNGAIRLDTNKDLYWNWPDDSEQGDRLSLIRSSATAAKLTEVMNGVVGLLSNIPDLRGSARHYDPRDKLESVRSTVIRGQGKILLESLLYTEATIIDLAAKAGQDIAEFREAMDKAPEAVKALSEFGDKLTRIFNHKLKTVFNPDDPASKQILRSLGVLMFVEITEALDPLFEAQPTAALEVTVLKSGQVFPPEGFPDEITLGPHAISIRQRILDVGTTV